MPLFVRGDSRLVLDLRCRLSLATEEPLTSGAEEHCDAGDTAQNRLHYQASCSWVEVGDGEIDIHQSLAVLEREYSNWKSTFVWANRESQPEERPALWVVQYAVPGTLSPMAIRHDQGIVLRGYPFGESDRVVILISPNNGKLRTVAKGVRKTKSRFGGRLEPLTHVDLVLYEGRNLDTITQVSVIEAFPKVRMDLERVGVAGAMISAIDAVVQEGESAHRLFLLLHRGLKVLDSAQPDPGLLTAFYLKLAALVGVAPALGDCASCGGEVDIERFSFAAGGVVCSRCATPDAVKLRPGLIDYLAMLAVSELAKLPDNAGLANDGQGLTRRFLEYHLERKFIVTEVPGG